MEVEGRIVVINDTQQIGNNNFQKREVVIETEDEYPQKLLIEFVQAKCDLLDKFLEGENVKISINLRGREWVNPQGETKYFNSIQGWRIESLDSNTSQNDAFEPANDLNEEEHDDLPF